MARPRSERAGDQAVAPTLRELQAAQRRYEVASTALAAARSERGAAVLKARTEALLTWREISEQLGTSVQRAEAIFADAVVEQIEALRKAGRTWRQIEDKLGIERGRAEQLARRRPSAARRLPPKGKPQPPA